MGQMPHHSMVLKNALISFNDISMAEQISKRKKKQNMIKEKSKIK